MILLRGSHYNDLKTLNIQGLLAHSFIMSEENTEEKQSFTKEWGSSTKKVKSLFRPEDFDIFCDRNTDITYIFHGPDLGCTIDYLEYNPETQRVLVFTKDGQKMDLGMRIQWLVRPYFARAQDIFIIQTKDGQPVDGVEVELRIKGQKTLN